MRDVARANAGGRIIYLDLPRAHRLDLITINSKIEQDDLSPAEKKVWRKLVDLLRAEAEAQTHRPGNT